MKPTSLQPRLARRSPLLHTAAATALVSVFLAASPAHAQTADAPPAPPVPEGQAQTIDQATPPAADTSAQPDIIVTGSRVTRAGYTAPTPVTSVSNAEIAREAPSTIGDVLARIPSFRASSTPNTSGNASLGGGQIQADLRGLGTQRTLVLVNGQRFVSSNINGTVDLAQIPTLLVDHVDVVTGGASAAWGSDAVAGVVNLGLKDHLDGLIATVQAGVAQAGDNSDEHLAFAFGGHAADNRLTYLLGADYFANSGMGSQFARDWGRKSYGLITNTNYATNGLPNYIISPDVQINNMTPGGLINSGPLKGIAFGQGGTPYNFTYGQVYGSSMIGGDAPWPNPTLSAQFSKPYSALSGLGHVQYQVSDHLNAYLDVSGSSSTADGVSQEARDTGILIHADNAYLPDSVKTQMADAGVSTITVGRISEDTGLVRLHSVTHTARAIFGLKGDLGGSWKWDAAYQYGYSTYKLKFGPNNRKQQNFLLAADAVTDPASGDVVCRSTLTDPDNGCIPVDIFGPNAESLNDYVNGTATYDLTNKLQVADANLQGEPFSTWAGPVSIATGVEWRDVSGHAETDAVSQQLQPSGTTGGWLYGNQKPFSGSYNVYEGYLETVIPLLQDFVLAKKLEFNGAVRYTHYSISGGVTTWKIGGNWQPFSDLRFRATRSRDIRAPSLSELFIGGTGSVYPIVFDPALNQAVQIQQVNTGNLDLKPEIADTFTGGFVYQPSWAPGLGLTVDYFNTRVKDVIYSVGATAIAQGCFAGTALYCDSISFNSDGTINHITSQPLNLNGLKTSGVDFEGSYGFSLGGSSRINIHALATYTAHFITTYPTGPQDTIGQLSAYGGLAGLPHWSGTADVTYTGGEFMANLQTRVIGSGVFNNDLTTGAGAANTINRNNIPAYAYLNLTLQYGIDTSSGHHFEIFGVVNNLLDKDPPLIPSGTSGGTSGSSTNAVFYDVIGRSFRIGARIRM